MRKRFNQRGEQRQVQSFQRSKNKTAVFFANFPNTPDKYATSSAEASLWYVPSPDISWKTTKIDKQCIITGFYSKNQVSKKCQMSFIVSWSLFSPLGRAGCTHFYVIRAMR
ncbi:hypothetical protein [Desulfoluna butyratoxydans]|uniref:hypothetical protein n=1 Tax=Desulfoluna butyratoxydans TaxID=231438 RepID=UPI0015D20415|nr:hypothetical protein [Desulfoluna butyratoxydans]